MGSFSQANSIECERFKRQKGRCAWCDKELSLDNYRKADKGGWEAHHIDGNPDNNALGNCAVVCINEPENCHLKVAHGGDFRNGKLAPRDRFQLYRF